MQANSVVVVVGSYEGGFIKQDVFSRSALQLQSIIKKVIAHFHDFSVLFSVVSSVSQ